MRNILEKIGIIGFFVVFFFATIAIAQASPFNNFDDAVATKHTVHKSNVVSSKHKSHKVYAKATKHKSRNVVAKSTKHKSVASSKHKLRKTYAKVNKHIPIMGATVAVAKTTVAAASTITHQSIGRSFARHPSGVGARPSRWCGWYMRSIKGGGPEYNLAANWLKRGRPSGPQVGAVVVWNSPRHHHVGLITGRTSAGWVVLSGNDGGAVRERVRSVSGAEFRII